MVDQRCRVVSGDSVMGCCGQETAPMAPSTGVVYTKMPLRQAAWRRRKAICETCKTRTTSTIPLLGNVETCGPILTKQEAEHCGCIIKLKVMIPGQRCPQGKW